MLEGKFKFALRWKLFSNEVLLMVATLINKSNVSFLYHVSRCSKLVIEMRY